MSYPIFMPVLLHSCVTVILVRSIATTICREIQNKSNELINHIKDLPSSCTYYVLPKNMRNFQINLCQYKFIVHKIHITFKYRYTHSVL